MSQTTHRNVQEEGEDRDEGNASGLYDENDTDAHAEREGVAARRLSLGLRAKEMEGGHRS